MPRVPPWFLHLCILYSSFVLVLFVLFLIMIGFVGQMIRDLSAERLSRTIQRYNWQPWQDLAVSFLRASCGFGTALRFLIACGHVGCLCGN